MGVSLITIGNHKLNFEGKTRMELVGEILNILKDLRLDNEAYWRYSAFAPFSYRKDLKNRYDLIHSIKTQTEWEYIDYEEGFTEEKTLVFNGPFDMQLYVRPGSIDMDDPGYRYYDWFYLDEYSTSKTREEEPEINESRKLFYRMVKAFGGDRAIYLPDSGIELSRYIDYFDVFEIGEEKIRKELGEPKKTFLEVEHGSAMAYMIDTFETIDWTKHVEVSKNWKEPECLWKGTFAEEDYNTKDKQKHLIYDEEMIAFREKNGNHFFYHIAAAGGIVVRHTGTLGGEEKTELEFREFNPMEKKEMIFEIPSNYYSHKINSEIECRIKYFPIKGKEIEWDKVIEAFKTEIIWRGIGEFKEVKSWTPDGSYYYAKRNEISETGELVYFNAPVFSLAKDLFFELIYKYDAKGKVIIKNKGESKQEIIV